MSSYIQGGAVFRGDLTGLVEHARGTQTTYIGARAATPIPVGPKNGQYPVLTIAAGNLLRDELKRQAPGGNRARVSRAYSQDTYNTVRFELEEAIADERKAEMNRWGWDLTTKATEFLGRQAFINHEIAAAAVFQNTGTWTVTSAGTAYTVANLATFDIGLDVDTAKGAINARGESVDNLTAIIPFDVFIRARASTKLQNRIRGNMSSDAFLDLGAQAMADALGVRQVLVANGIYDAAQEGVTSSLTRIWANTHIWIGQVADGDFFTGGAVRTLHATEELPELHTIRTYRDDNTFSDVVNIATDYAVKVVNANAGQLIATSYS